MQKFFFYGAEIEIKRTKESILKPKLYINHVSRLGNCHAYVDFLNGPIVILHLI